MALLELHRNHVTNPRLMHSPRDKTDKVGDEKILNERTSQSKRNLSLFFLSFFPMEAASY